MPTLVTGAGGFIGSAVVRSLLARGRDVRCMLAPGEPSANIDDLDVEVVHADVLDADAVARAIDGCGVVYHLAAVFKLWTRNPQQLYRVNVEGSRAVLSAARSAGVDKIVYTSSIAAVGRSASGPADETCEFQEWTVSDDYMRSKWLSEQIAVGFAAEGLPVVIVNPAIPFGARDRVPTPTGRTLVEILKGRLPGYMSGGICAVDVDDCADAHVLAEDKGRVGERYILGSHNVSNEEFVTKVAEVGGVRRPRRIPRTAVLGVARCAESVARLTRRSPPYTVKAVRYASRNAWFDSGKATAELGMRHTPLGETIEKAVGWFRKAGYV